MSDIASEQPVATPPVAQRRQRSSIWLLVFALCALVAVLNQVAVLKDREVYQNYYESVGSCDGLACMLISDDVRSPVFLSLIVLGQRTGVDFNLIFTLISVSSICVFAAALRGMHLEKADLRFVFISLALGTWLYLIQVKLFLAVALYLYSKSRRRRWLRVALVIASVLTHESMLFFLVLDFLWRPREWRLSMRSLALLAIFATLLMVSLGAASNIFLNVAEKIQQYNEYAGQGEVPPMSRLSPFAAFFFMFGLIGLLRLRVAPDGAVDATQLKAAIWMFLPWALLMVFASNAVFAVRLSELALLHALLVVPITGDYRMPSRLLLLVFATTFGALTFVRDVLFG
jgi:hypothetical protein